MEEQSGDTMPIPIGGVCYVCNEPCCLQESCSVVCNGNKRYCNRHKPLFYVSFIFYSPLKAYAYVTIRTICDHRQQGTLVFVENPVQRVGDANHYALDHKYNCTQDALSEKNRPHEMDIVDTTVFGWISHFALAVERVHLRQDDDHTAKTDTLRSTDVTVIQRGAWCSNTEVEPS